MIVAIREMTIADYEDARRLWETTEGIGLSGADSPEGIATYLERNPGLSLVAQHAGSMIGTVLCGHDGRRGYLHHLAVVPEYRGQGLGGRLVGTCLAKLAALGIDKCHVWVYARNQAGQEFWQRIGWRERDDLRIMSKETRCSKASSG